MPVLSTLSELCTVTISKEHAQEMPLKNACLSRPRQTKPVNLELLPMYGVGEMSLHGVFVK